MTSTLVIDSSAMSAQTSRRLAPGSWKDLTVAWGNPQSEEARRPVNTGLVPLVTVRRLLVSDRRRLWNVMSPDMMYCSSVFNVWCLKPIDKECCVFMDKIICDVLVYSNPLKPINRLAYCKGLMIGLWFADPFYAMATLSILRLNSREFTVLYIA